MATDPENRDNVRISRKASILLENFRSEDSYEAKMYNYSQSGMYFESNYAPLPGSDIYIGIENSPYDCGPDIYRAQVRWRKRLAPGKSAYSYGVGVKYYQLETQ